MKYLLTFIALFAFTSPAFGQNTGDWTSDFSEETSPDDTDVFRLQKSPFAAGVDRYVDWDNIRLGMFTLADDPLSFANNASLGVTHRSLTTAERDATSPAAGAVIWNETTAQLEHWNGSAWATPATIGFPTPEALPADPATLVTEKHYYSDAIAATYSVTLPASPSEGDRIYMDLINPAETVLTFLTTLPYRAGGSSTISTITLPIGNHELSFRYSNSKWRMADTGVDDEAGIYLAASGGTAPPAFDDTSAGILGAITDEVGTGFIMGNTDAVAVGTFAIGDGTTASGILQIDEDDDAGSNFASFQVPALAANTVYTLPPDDGDAGQVLESDGAGVLTWGTPAGLGDMLQATYDQDTNNSVDTSETVVIEVNNDSGVQIDDGDVVYVSNFDIPSDLPEIELADSDSGATMPVVGIVRGNIANGADGVVVISGIWEGNTTAFNQLDVLYVSGTAGELTTTKPTGTALIQKVGMVARDHVSAGQIVITGAGRSNDLPNVASANFWLGSGTGVATAVTMSGDATMNNAGAITVAGADGLNSATTTVAVSAATAPSAGQVLTATNSTTATWQDAAAGGTYSLFDEDFLFVRLGTSSSMEHFAGAVTGTGSATRTYTGEADAPGIARVENGTTVDSGLASLYTGQDSSLQNILIGGGAYSLTWRFRVGPAISDGTNTYALNMGFSDEHTATSASEASGVGIRYTHSVSANFVAYSLDDASTSTVTSGVALTANTWHTGRIEVNAAASSITYFVDDTSLGAAITTNIPTEAGEEMGLRFSIERTLGSTEQTLDIDRIRLQWTETTDRLFP